jgi:hypothetical protein
MGTMQTSIGPFFLAVLVTLAGITGCAPRSSPKTSAGETTPDQLTRPVLPIALSISSWNFQNDTHPYRYELVNVTSLKLQTDTAQPEEDTVATSMTFALALDTGSPAYRISGEITHTSTQTGRRIGQRSPRQASSILFKGSYDNGQLEIHTEGSRPTTVPCSDSTIIQLTRLYNQVNTVPPAIQGGMRWQDSLMVLGCQGPVPIQINVARWYQVIGETMIAKQRAVTIQRSDSIQISGEGSEGQHRISFEGRGTGTSKLFLSATTGRLLASDSQQVIIVLTKVSGRLLQFTQQTKETIRSAP